MQEERNDIKKQRKIRGITLVALVVTIVVLIILATISINIIFGEEGIVERTKQAKQDMANAEIEEKQILADAANTMEEHIVGERENVTISKEEYEQLLEKANNIGETYTKTNTITISSKSAWTDVANATWTIPAGTWIINFNFYENNTGTGIWSFQLSGLGIADAYWKNSSDWGMKYFTWIKTFEEETTGYFRYYQALSATSRNIDFTMNAVRIK